MRCPYCHTIGQTKITNSRFTSGNGTEREPVRRRHRICLACNLEFDTVESCAPFPEDMRGKSWPDESKQKAQKVPE